MSQKIGKIKGFYCSTVHQEDLADIFLERYSL